MTKEAFKNWNEQANFGLVPDDENPAFILSVTNIDLLSQIAKGEIDMIGLAKRTLESNGLDINGKWTGFDKEIL